MIIELDIADGDDRDYYFLSYDHEDAERVSEIIQKLTWSGVNIWYDKGLLPGDEIRTILAEKIKNSKAVIMFVTNTIWAKENSFVQQEYDVAREIYRKRIIIVLLDKINFDSIPAHKAFWTSQIKNMLCIKGYDGESPMEVTEEILKAARMLDTNLPEDQPSKAERKTNSQLILKNRVCSAFETGIIAVSILVVFIWLLLFWRGSHTPTDTNLFLTTYRLRAGSRSHFASDIQKTAWNKGLHPGVLYQNPEDACLVFGKIPGSYNPLQQNHAKGRTIDRKGKEYRESVQEEYRGRAKYKAPFSCAF